MAAGAGGGDSRQPHPGPGQPSATLIGAISQVVPIVSATDYAGNSAADGSGSNLTANVSVVTRMEEAGKKKGRRRKQA
jgi:hypothetical protein